MGVSESDLQTDLQSGKTLAQLLSARRHPRRRRRRPVDPHRGRSPQAQADQFATILKERVTEHGERRPPGARRLRQAGVGGLPAAGSSRPRARTSSSTPGPRRRWCPGAFTPGGTPSQGLEHHCGDGRPERHLLAVARARSRDPLVVSLEQPPPRRQRPRARGRSQPFHDAPVHLDPRRARSIPGSMLPGSTGPSRYFLVAGSCWRYPSAARVEMYRCVVERLRPTSRARSLTPRRGLLERNDERIARPRSSDCE